MWTISKLHPSHKMWKSLNFTIFYTIWAGKFFPLSFQFGGFFWWLRSCIRWCRSKNFLVNIFLTEKYHYALTNYALKTEHFGVSLSKIGPPVTLSWLKVQTKIDKKWLEKTALVKAISPEIAIFLAHFTNILCFEWRICRSISKILRKSIKSVHFKNWLPRGTQKSEAPIEAPLNWFFPNFRNK